MYTAKHLRTVFVIILLSFVFSLAARAQMIPGMDTGLGGANSIVGMVLGPSGQRIERRLSVRIMTPTKGDRVTTTDDYGNFAFRGLVAGEYTIVIDKEKEFQSYSMPVTIIQPRGFPAQSFNVNIRLSYKEGQTAKPGVVNADLAKVPKHALDAYNKAIELGKTGDREGAIQQLRSAINEYPEFVDAYNEMGVQYLKLGNVLKADEAFTAALKIDPKAFGPMINHGIALFSMKQYSNAEPVLRDVVSAKDDHAAGHYFLGQTVAYLGKFDEAEKELLVAIELGGDATMKEAHRLLGIIYSSRKDNKRAADELDTYLKLNPSTPDAEQLREAVKKLRATATPEQ
jgi:Flp pilus assembly protein TadD